MNKDSLFSSKLPRLLMCLAFISPLLLLPHRAFATVGGPIYISEIAYNPLNNVLYYTKHDLGGRGCLPILHGVDLTNGQDSEVKSCEQTMGETEESNQAYLTAFYRDLTPLFSVDLAKNHLKIEVQAIDDHAENGEKYWTNFKAVVLQDNHKLAEVNFTGCEREQPHTFEGYLVPNSNQLALLVSNVGDCFEGGYTQENLFLVNGVKYYQSTAVRGYKQASATEPNMGNMVVRATPAQTFLTKETIKLGAAGLGILALGTIFGLIIGRKTHVKS